MTKWSKLSLEEQERRLREQREAADAARLAEPITREMLLTAIDYMVTHYVTHNDHDTNLVREAFRELGEIIR